MKKLLLSITALIFFASFSFATEVVALTIEGKRFNGNLQEVSDSSLTIYNRNTLKKYTIMFTDLVEMTDAMGGRYNVVNGNLIYQTFEERDALKRALEKERMGNPNYAIGKALKSAGSALLAFGVPSLFVGSILLAAGYAKPNQLLKMKKDLAAGKKVDQTKYKKLVTDVAENGKTYGNCATAGCVLMPLGGALTIIGIPLYVHGKNIMELALQLSDNGPGVAVKF